MAHYVIRNARILSMDTQIGDLAQGDVRIEAGVIADVGPPGIPAAGATVIDGTGMIVMPGLIDAHTHLWGSQMRGLFGATADTTYFRKRNQFADVYRPEDVFQGTRLGAAECLFSGITTTVDFFHNNRGPDYSSAALDALEQTGIRCRFLFGGSTNMAPDESINLAELERLAGSWRADAPLTLGLAWRGPLGIMVPTADCDRRPPVAVAREEFEAARRLNLPIAIHVSGAVAAEQFSALERGDFLGPDLQIIHFTGASPAAIETAARAGASLCLTPLTELRVGYGITALGDFLAGGMRVGLGVDGSALAGAANLFSVMKLLQNLETGRLQNESAISARRLLELATIDGARSIGMEGQIGSLTPGKRADVIMIDTQALNMGMFCEDPAGLLVESTQPANVDTVFVDGRLLKRGGRMTQLDPTEVIRAAQLSAAAMTARVNQRSH